MALEPGMRVVPLEDVSTIDEIDILCPNCGEVVRENYDGKTTVFFAKCPNCPFEIEEYSGVAVPSGRADEATLELIRDRLREYWQQSHHREARRESFERVANELDIRLTY